MKTHAKLKSLIANLKALGDTNIIYDGSVTYNIPNPDIHFFNSFNQTMVAIECLKPKVESENHAQLIEDIFAKRNQIDLPNFIKESTDIKDFKLQLQKPFIIIDGQKFILRLSIFDSINNDFIKNGLLKLLTVHNKEYNSKPKENNTFYENENTVFELITSISLCRIHGKYRQEKELIFYEWNGYRLIIEKLNEGLIENVKSFYPLKGQESGLKYLT